MQEAQGLLADLSLGFLGGIGKNTRGRAKLQPCGKTQSLLLRCVYSNDVERAWKGREVEIKFLLRRRGTGVGGSELIEKPCVKGTLYEQLPLLKSILCHIKLFMS